MKMVNKDLHPSFLKSAKRKGSGMEDKRKKSFKNFELEWHAQDEMMLRFVGPTKFTLSIVDFNQKACRKIAVQ